MEDKRVNNDHDYEYDRWGTCPAAVSLARGVRTYVMSLTGEISVKIGDIVKERADAIVNAANEQLTQGGGVCGAIFRAAGEKDLRAACEKIGRCETGGAVLTPAFKLPAKYIIHAVGVRYKDGKHGEERLLYGAYRSALGLAQMNGCDSIAFPLISSGIYGYPVEEAWAVAIKACYDFLEEIKGTGCRMKIAIVVKDENTYRIGEEKIVDLYTKDRKRK